MAWTSTNEQTRLALGYTSPLKTINGVSLLGEGDISTDVAAGVANELQRRDSDGTFGAVLGSSADNLGNLILAGTVTLDDIASGTTALKLTPVSEFNADFGLALTNSSGLNRAQLTFNPSTGAIKIGAASGAGLPEIWSNSIKSQWFDASGNASFVGNISLPAAFSAGATAIKVSGYPSGIGLANNDFNVVFGGGGHFRSSFGIGGSGVSSNKAIGWFNNLNTHDATALSAKLTYSSNVILIQSASGASFRDMAGTGYTSATAQAFYATDYVQGVQRVLVGNSSGGRLLPITDGLAVYNWAQSALGSLNLNALTSSNASYPNGSVSIKQQYGTGPFAGGAVFGSGNNSTLTQGIEFKTTAGTAKYGIGIDDSGALHISSSSKTKGFLLHDSYGTGVISDGNVFTIGSSFSVYDSTWTNFGTANVGKLVANSANPESSSVYVIDSRQIWSNAPTTFTANRFNITDLGSANGSKVIDIQTDGTSRVSVNKVASATNHTAPYRLVLNNAASLAWSSELSAMTVRNATNTADVAVSADSYYAGNAGYRFSNASGVTMLPFMSSYLMIQAPIGVYTIDSGLDAGGFFGGYVNLNRTAAATTSAPVIDAAQTWNNAAASFTFIKGNVTDTASLSTSKLIDLQVGSVSKFSVDKSGSLTASKFEATAGSGANGFKVGNWTIDANGQILTTYYSGGRYFQINQNTGVVSTSANAFVLGNVDVGSGSLRLNNSSQSLQVTDQSAAYVPVEAKELYTTLGTYTGGTKTTIQTELTSTGLGFASAGVIHWAPASTYTSRGDVFNVSDLKVSRNAVGQLDVRGDSGLRVRNYANTAWANINSSSVAIAGDQPTLSITQTPSVDPSNNIIYATSNGKDVFKAQVQGYGGAASGFYFGAGTTASPAAAQFTMTIASTLAGGVVMGTPAGAPLTVGSGGSRMTWGYYYNEFPGSHVFNGGTVTSTTPLQFNQTWNNGATAFTGIQANFTNTASAATSKFIDFQIGGTSQFSVGRDGIRLRAAGYESTNHWRISVDNNNPVVTTTGGNGSVWYDNNGRLYLYKIGDSGSNYILGQTNGTNGQSIDLGSVVRLSNFSGYANVDSDLGLRVRIRSTATLATVTAGKAELYPVSASDKGLLIKHPAAPTGNSIEFQNSSGTAFTYFKPNSGFTIDASSNMPATNNFVRPSTGLDLGFDTTNGYQTLSLWSASSSWQVSIHGSSGTRMGNRYGDFFITSNGHQLKNNPSPGLGGNLIFEYPNTTGSATAGYSKIQRTDGTTVTDVTTWNNASKMTHAGQLAVANGSITSSTPMLDLSQTWNNVATTFTGIVSNVTDTASTTTSKLLDLQVGSVSKFYVDKYGNTTVNNLTVNGTSNISTPPGGSTGQLQYNDGTSFAGVTGSYVSGSNVTLAGNFCLPADKQIEFGSVGIIKQSSNLLYLQSANGIRFRNMGDTAYTSAVGEAFIGTDYIQGYTAVRVGQSSGGRLLPITDGVAVYNWAQSALGSLNAGTVNVSGWTWYNGVNVGIYAPDASTLLFSTAGTSNPRLAFHNAHGLTLASMGTFGWTNTSAMYSAPTQDALLARNATGPAVQVQAAGGLNVKDLAGTSFAQVSASQFTGTGGTVTSSTPVVNVTQTWNSAGTSFTAAKVNITDTASASTSYLLDLQVGSVSKFSVDKAGNTVLNNLTVNGTHNITMTASPGGVNGNIQYNNGGSLGGISNTSVDGSGNITFGSSNYLQFGTTLPVSIRRGFLYDEYVETWATAGLRVRNEDGTAPSSIDVSDIRRDDDEFLGFSGSTVSVPSGKDLNVVSGNAVVGGDVTANYFRVSPSPTDMYITDFMGSSMMAVAPIGMYFVNTASDGALVVGGKYLATKSTALTVSEPAYDASQTWNNNAAIFTLFKGNVSDTASAATSKLLDLQVGSVTKFSVDKYGNTTLNNLTVNGTHNITPTPAGTNGQLQYNNAGTMAGVAGSTADGSGNITFSGTLSSGRHTITGGTVTSSLPVIDATQTWNSVGTTFTGLKVNVTDTTSASGSKLFDFQVGGTTKVNADKSGNLVTGNQITLTPTDTFGTTQITAGNYGVLSLGLNGGYLAVAGTSRLIYTGSQFSPLNHNAMDLGQSATRFKDAYLQGTLYTNTGLSITGELRTAVVTVADRQGSPVLRANSDVNANMLVASYNTTTGTKGFLGGIGGWANMLGLGSDMAIGFSSLANDTPYNLSNAVDSKIVRSSAGQLDVRGDSGLRVRNLANSADAAITATGISSNSGTVTVNAAATAVQLNIGGTNYVSVQPSAIYMVNHLAAFGTYDVGTSGNPFRSVILGGTVTTSTPAVNVTQTWNSGATAFTAMSFDITDTASANGSKMFRFGTGTAELSLKKVASAGNHTAAFRLVFGDSVSLAYSPEYGKLTVRNGANTGDGGIVANEFQSLGGVSAVSYFQIGNHVEMGSTSWRGGAHRAITIDSSGGMHWSSTSSVGGTVDVGVNRNAAGVVEVNSGSVNDYRDLIVRNLTTTGGTVTSSAPPVNLTQTWNSGAVVFTAMKANVTDTASASTSKLLDLQVGSVTKFSVDKAGNTVLNNLTVNGTHNITPTPAGTSGQLQYNNAGTMAGVAGSTADGSGNITFSGTFASGRQTITGGTVTSSSPVITATQTWNSAGVTFNGVSLDVTDTASAAASTLIDLKVGGTSKFSVSKAGISTGFSAVFAQGASGSPTPFVDVTNSVGGLRLSAGGAGTLYVRNGSDSLGQVQANVLQAVDYIQGQARILVGNSSGGRLLPITDGVAVYNWAQSAHGKLQANEVRIMHPSDSNYGPRLQYGHQNGINVVSSDGTFRGFIGSGYGNSNGALVGSFGAIGSETYGLWTGAAGKFRIASVPGPGGTTYVEFGRDATTGAGTVASDTGLNVKDLAGTSFAQVSASSGVFAKSDTTWADANIPTVSVENTATTGNRTAVIKARVSGGYVSSQPEIWVGAENSYLVNGTYIRTVSNHPMYFRTNDVDRMVIAASGAVSIHNSLSQQSTSQTAAIKIQKDSVSGYGVVTFDGGTTASSMVGITGSSGDGNLYAIGTSGVVLRQGGTTLLTATTTNVDSTVNINAPTITAVSGASGRVCLSYGNAPHTGFIEWKNSSNVRTWYMGYDNGNNLSLVPTASTYTFIVGGPINAPAGSSGVPSIQIGAANTGFYNSGSNIRVTTNGSITSGFYSGGLETTGVIAFTASSPGSGIADAAFLRSAIGQVDYRGDAGLRVKNVGGTADAPFSASTGLFSGKLTRSAASASDTIGIEIGNGSLTASPSSYPYIRMVSSWGNHDLMTWGGRVAFYGSGTAEVVSPKFRVDSTGAFEIASGSAYSASSDVIYGRNATGPAAQIQAAGGLNVKDLAGTGWANIAIGTLTMPGISASFVMDGPGSNTVRLFNSASIYLQSNSGNIELRSAGSDALKVLPGGGITMENAGSNATVPTLKLIPRGTQAAPLLNLDVSSVTAGDAITVTDNLSVSKFSVDKAGNTVLNNLTVNGTHNITAAPGGSSGQFQYNNAGSLAGISGSSADGSGNVSFTGTLASGRQTITGGTVTSSSPAVDIAQTWNNAAVTFNGIYANVVDTASASGSLLMNLQVNTSTQASIDKSGNAILAGKLSFGTTSSYPTLQRVASRLEVRKYDNSGYQDLWANNIVGIGNVTSQAAIVAGTSLSDGTGWLPGGVGDVRGYRTGTNALAFDNGSGGSISHTVLGTSNVTGGTVTSSAPVFNATQTWNNVATTFTGIKLDVTDTTSASASLLMDLQVAATSKFSVSKAGTVTSSRFVGSIQTGQITTATDGAYILESSNDGTTSTLFRNVTSPLIRIGGTTSSFPAIKRSTTNLQFRLADDSADAPITASSIGASSTSANFRIDVPTYGVGANYGQLYFNNSASYDSYFYFNAAVPFSGGTNNFGIRYRNNGQADLGVLSANYINFQPASNTLVGSWNFPASANYPSPKLCAATNSGSEVYWALTRTGTGAGQTIQGYTYVYALTGIPAALDFRAKSIQLGAYTDVSSSHAWNDVSITNKVMIDSSGFTVTGPTILTGGTVTSSSPIISGTQTWNNVATTFTGILSNVTDTASASGSKLLDLQVGAVSKFSVDKAGNTVLNNLTVNGTHNITAAPGGSSGQLQYNNAGSMGGVSSSSVSGANITFGGSITQQAASQTAAITLNKDSGNGYGLLSFNGGTAWASTVGLTGSSGDGNLYALSTAGVILRQGSDNLVTATTSGIDASYTFTAPTVRAKNGSSGYIAMVTGDASFTGYLEWRNAAGTRKWGMGYNNNNDLTLFSESSGSLALGSVSYPASMRYIGTGSSATISTSTGSTLDVDKPLSITGGTVTASTPVFNSTQTWNNVATTFTGIKLNVTDTTSASGSLLLDLQVGGTSKFSVAKSGLVTTPSTVSADAVVGATYISSYQYLIGSNVRLRNAPTSVDGDLSVIKSDAVTIGNVRSGTFTLVNPGASQSATDWAKIKATASGTIAFRNATDAADAAVTALTGTFSGGTVTSSTPVVSVAQTWNSAGVTFTGILSNITDTASASGSKLLDLQVGSVSKFSVDKAGNTSLNNLTVNGTHNITAAPGGSSGQFQYNNAGTMAGVSGSTADGSGNVTFSGTLASGRQTITGGTVTSSSPTMDITQTWNSAGVTFTGIKSNITDTASATASMLLDLQVGGTSKFSVTKAGAVTAASTLAITSTTSTSDRITVKDDGGATWSLSTGGVANTDGVRLVKIGTADMISFRPSLTQFYTPIATTTTISAVTGTLTGGTVTASTPTLDISQTWNNVAAAFTGLKQNITNTASLSTSKLFDFQVGGTSKIYGDVSGTLVVTNKLTVGAAGTPTNMMYVEDWQSTVNTFKISKPTWGSPLDLSWATESAGIVSNGPGPIIAHTFTITGASLSNAAYAGGSIDARCEYDNPYIAGISVRGRKTRTDAPTHPNLAYGIYAIANSGKASGLGGAAGYFLCETPNVAGVQIVGAASQSQPLFLVQSSAAATLAQIDQTGNITSYGYSGVLAANGGFYGHQDGAFALGMRFSLRTTADSLLNLRNYANTDYADFFARSLQLNGYGSTRNLFINAGNASATGQDNVFIGSIAGSTAASLSSGNYNTVVGGRYTQGAGKSLTTGSENSFFGNAAGSVYDTGAGNTHMGYFAGYGATGTGGTNYNTSFGYLAGYQANGSSNLYLGNNAGRAIVGSNNIHIGVGSSTAITESNKLRLGNVATPMISGDISTKAVDINGATTVNPPGNSDKAIVINAPAGSTVNAIEMIKSATTQFSVSSSGVVMSMFDTKGSAIVAGDVPTGGIKVIKETTGGITRIYINDGGTLKQSLPFVNDAGSSGWTISNYTSHKTLDLTTTTMTEMFNFVATLAQRMKDLGLIT